MSSGACEAIGSGSGGEVYSGFGGARSSWGGGVGGGTVGTGDGLGRGVGLGVARGSGNAGSVATLTTCSCFQLRTGPMSVGWGAGGTGVKIAVASVLRCSVTWRKTLSPRRWPIAIEMSRMMPPAMSTSDVAGRRLRTDRDRRGAKNTGGILGRPAHQKASGPELEAAEVFQPRDDLDLPVHERFGARVARRGLNDDIER